MVEIPERTQKFIKHLEGFDFLEPAWDEEAATEAIQGHYEALGLPKPPVQVFDDLATAWRTLGPEAKRGTKSVSSDAAWCAAWTTTAELVAEKLPNTPEKEAWLKSLETGEPTEYSEIDSRLLNWLRTLQYLAKAHMAGVGWYIPMEDVVGLVRTPRLVGDPLHYDQGKAVEWPNGEGYYFLRGVRFSEDLWKKITSQTLTAEEAFAIRNTDQRAIAIAMLRPDRMLAAVKAELMHVGIKGTKLYRIPNFLDSGTDAYCMWMHDHATPREFIEFVPPEVAQVRRPKHPDGDDQDGEVGDADYCQAAAWKITRKQYLSIIHEG